jgi:uncharacterized surface protein with fasciclin (FAS1) repeats
MIRSKLQKSISLILGVAIVSTGLGTSVSTYAQSGTPGTITSPSPKPGDAMSKPGDAMSKPGDAMSKPGKKPAMAAPAGKTIVDIAGKSKLFTTLVTALKAADLAETLAGEGPYTVFAPTNAAFAKLPKATLAKLLQPENKEQLQQLLNYHVVAGAVTSKMLKAGQIDTIQGGKITVKIKGKKVMINNATVLLADVKASNGIIHAIDTVIMPPTK